MSKGDSHLVYGIRAIIESIESGKELERVLLQQGLKGDLAQQLAGLARKQGIPLSRVPVVRMNKVTRKNHQGAIAFVSPIRYQPVDEIITQLYEAGKEPLILVLDGVTDVRNFGSIARSAECLGVHAVVIPIKGGAQVSADAVKTSAGALNFLPVSRSMHLPETVRQLKESGLQLIACTEKATHTLYETELRGPVALIMGSEDVGISAELLAMADVQVSIPMQGQIASMNVSAACAVVLAEIARQSKSE